MFYASKTIFGKTKDDEILQCSCAEIRERSFQNILKVLNSFLKTVNRFSQANRFSYNFFAYTN